MSGYIPGTTLTVLNIPWEATWQELKDVFKQYGMVAFAEIVKGPDGRPQGKGTVRFLNPDDAARRAEMGARALGVGRGVVGRDGVVGARYWERGTGEGEGESDSSVGIKVALTLPHPTPPLRATQGEGGA